jgi:hypothetical protein
MIVTGGLFCVGCITEEEPVLYVIPTLEERSDAVSRYKILTYLLLN